MLNSAPHPTLAHLQITFEPEAYNRIWPAILDMNYQAIMGIDLDRDYWPLLTTYLFARCPICGATYTGKLDTHSLNGVGGPNLVGGAIASKKWQTIGCQHFVAVQNFVNLNEFTPKEVIYFANKSLDAPFVMPIFLPDDIESYVVLHSLPICRIEAGQFMPRYAIYMLTYYAVKPKMLIARRYAEQVQHQDDQFPPLLYPEPQTRVWRDLALWVERGKLQWLDPGHPDLPLKTGPPEALPYADVQPSAAPYAVIRYGELKPF